MAGYAKLVGRIGINDENEVIIKEFLITDIPCMLGRVVCKQSYSIVIDTNDVLLSRQHVQITWSKETGLCIYKYGSSVYIHVYPYIHGYTYL